MSLTCTFSSREMLILSAFIHSISIFFMFLLFLDILTLVPFKISLSLSVPDSSRTLQCIKLVLWKKHSFIGLASMGHNNFHSSP